MIFFIFNELINSTSDFLIQILPYPLCTMVKLSHNFHINSTIIKNRVGNIFPYDFFCLELSS